MIVVSDSSPLNFLIRLGHADLLPTMFGRVAVPPQVVAELSRPTTPEVVSAFVSRPPLWLQIQAPSRIIRIPRLHEGEQAAINLAIELHADLILLDDADARRAGIERGLAVTGLLGILERADERGLLSITQVVAQLPADYRIDAALVRAAAQRSAARSGSTPAVRPGASPS